MYKYIINSSLRIYRIKLSKQSGGRQEILLIYFQFHSILISRSSPSFYESQSAAAAPPIPIKTNPLQLAEMRNAGLIGCYSQLKRT